MIRKFKKIRRRRFNPPGLKLRQARKRKSILRNRFFWDFILFLTLGCLIFYFLFLSDIFKIKEIKIATSDEIPKKEILAFLEKELDTPFFHFLKKNTFFLINSKKIENEISNKYPEIKEVNLKKKFPKTLILEVEKRKAVGVWCGVENKCFLIDKKGTIFQTASASEEKDNLVLIFSENYGIKELGEKIIPEEKMSQILKIKNILEKEMGINTEKFTLKTPERLNVKTTEGWEIYFDLSEDINLAFTKLRLLLEKEISLRARKNLEYIDLRFSKVYYK